MATSTLRELFPPSFKHPATGSFRGRTSSGIMILLDSIPLHVLSSTIALLAVGLASASRSFGLPDWLVPTLLIAQVLAFLVRGKLITHGFISNPWAARIVPGMTRPIVPVPVALPSVDVDINEKSSTDPNAVPPTGSPEFAIVHLFARSNSPFGIFNPHFREVAAYFQGMVKNLEADREKSGLMNSETYLGTSRGTSNRVLTVFYFRSVEHVWKWTREGLHNSVWMKMAKGYEQYPSIEIGHELFVAKASGFEGIYVNTEPHGAGALSAKDDEEGSETYGMWLPTARAIGKKDRYSKARMTLQPPNVDRTTINHDEKV